MQRKSWLVDCCGGAESDGSATLHIGGLDYRVRVRSGYGRGDRGRRIGRQARGRRHRIAKKLPHQENPGRKRKRPDAGVDKDALNEQIGRLKVELEWLKKELVCSTEQRRLLVEPDHAEICVRRQCELPGVNRSGVYYQPVEESQENLMLMPRLRD